MLTSYWGSQNRRWRPNSHNGCICVPFCHLLVLILHLLLVLVNGLFIKSLTQKLSITNVLSTLIYTTPPNPYRCWEIISVKKKLCQVRFLVPLRMETPESLRATWSVSQPLPVALMLQPLNHLCGPLLGSLQYVRISLALVEPRTGHSSLDVASLVLNAEG